MGQIITYNEISSKLDSDYGDMRLIEYLTDFITIREAVSSSLSILSNNNFCIKGNMAKFKMDNPYQDKDYIMLRKYITLILPLITRDQLIDILENNDSLGIVKRQLDALKININSEDSDEQYCSQLDLMRAFGKMKVKESYFNCDNILYAEFPHITIKKLKCRTGKLLNEELKSLKYSFISSLHLATQKEVEEVKHILRERDFEVKVFFNSVLGMIQTELEKVKYSDLQNKFNTSQVNEELIN